MLQFSTIRNPKFRLGDVVQVREGHRRGMIAIVAQVHADMVRLEFTSNDARRWHHVSNLTLLHRPSVSARVA
jgi:hypothetical protein